MQSVTVMTNVFLILSLVPWMCVTASDIQAGQASAENSKDNETVHVFEPSSLASFLTKYGEKTGSQSVSKNGEELEPDEFMRNFGKSYPKEASDEFAQFKRNCKHFEKSSSKMGFAPDTVRRMRQACKEFLSSPTQETLDRLEDLEENMASEYLCLTRGVSHGLESGCPSQLRANAANHRSFYKRQQADPNDDLPDPEKIEEFNRNLASYCNERYKYENLQNRADELGERLAQSVMRYMDCLCDNRTDCGHLSHAAVKSFNENFVSPVTKQMDEMFEEGQKTEQELEKNKPVKGQDLVVPENITVQQAFQEMQNAKKNERQERSLDLSLPGCSISLDNKKCVSKQVFSCTVFKIVKITVTLEWKFPSSLSKVTFDVSLCIPFVEDIINILNKFPLLKSLLSTLNIKNGCLSVARATADFHKGILQASFGPKLSFLVVRATYQSTLLYRFDTRKPTYPSSLRYYYNRHGSRKYLELKSEFKAEFYFPFKWRCALCKTLSRETWVIYTRFTNAGQNQPF